jgi:hypothetical protein
MVMRRGRRIVHNVLTVLSLVLTVAIAVAWGVSAMSFPHVRGPMSGGEGAAQDHVLVCLVDGRLVAVRRVATLVAHSPDMRMTLEKQSVPSSPHDWPQPVPRVRVDLRDVREVMVEDYSVRPPQFAPESYRNTMSEREVIASQPWGWLGFDFGGNRAAKAFTISGGGSVSVTEQVWAMPLWPLLLASLVPVARWMWQNRQSRRWVKAGRCEACGYDLRATPGRCPECGKSAAPVAA